MPLFSTKIDKAEPLMNTISPAPKKSFSSQALKLLLKIAITILCFWYISTKIDFSKTWEALLRANWWWLLVGVLLYAFSKFISAFRLNIYFRNIGLRLSEWDNIKLYWLGMFYNLFLPGAISGDAYKVIILNRAHKAAYKKISSAVLLDRFSGLLGLGVLLSVYGAMVLDENLYQSILIGGTVLSLIILYLFIQFLFKNFKQGFSATFFIGVLVQAVQVVCVYAIMKSIGISANQSEWIFIFLASSAISVLPISLGGGLGTREVVFAEGARFFHLQPELGVVISLLFYLNNLLSSVWGAYYIFHEPLRNKSINQPQQAV
jgi:glycosyltransferase 2 family protein